MSKDLIYQPSQSSAKFIANLLGSTQMLPEEEWKYTTRVKFFRFYRRIKAGAARRLKKPETLNKVKKYKLATYAEKLPNGIKKDETHDLLSKLGFKNTSIKSPWRDVVSIEQKQNKS